MVGYDVRSARTPVELFDILGKNLVTLVLVDLGAATAGRREFWVALDAQRRGRASMQVLTFRYSLPASDLDLEFEPSARAIADVEIHGAHEFQRLIEAVRQRAPLHGPAPAAAVSYTPDGSIQPLGVALGMPLTPYGAQQEAAYGAYGSPSIPGQQPGFGAGNHGGYAHYQSDPNGGFAPQGFPASPPSMPQQPMMGYGAPMPAQYSARMETTPIEGGDYGAGFGPNAAPFGQPYPPSYPPSQPPLGQPMASASPFAHPTAANPFAAKSSPFAQPYGSNPFAQGMQGMQGMSAPNSQPPFGPGGSGAGANDFAQPGFPGLSLPSGPSGPSGFSGPSSWGASSGGYVADAPGFAGWRTPYSGPDSFSSDPGAQAARNAPVFQDAWSPPDAESEMQTSALSEDAFQPQQFPSTPQTPQTPPRRFHLEPPATGPVGPFSLAGNEGYQNYADSQPRPWEAPRVSSGGLGAASSAASSPSASFQERYEESTASVAVPPSAVQTQAMMRAPTPTETALGSVLVEGALLTPNKLETLRGIQTMLASVNMPRKLGELAVMFKFLSPDQLLAALLVSRGLVSPQQIASLGRVKQEMAASGLENDLETLLVHFNILPADQLRSLRQELAS